METGLQEKIQRVEVNLTAVETSLRTDMKETEKNLRTDMKEMEMVLRTESEMIYNTVLDNRAIMRNLTAWKLNERTDKLENRIFALETVYQKQNT